MEQLRILEEHLDLQERCICHQLMHDKKKEATLLY